MTFRVILKNGTEFTVKADNLEQNKTFGELTGLKFVGVSENKPCYLDLSAVVAIIRKISDEETKNE